MNNDDQASVPPTTPANPASAPSVPDVYPKPLSWWLKKLFVCNPFYLVSAALLLYGCYRVAIDAPMFNLEIARLLFNFTSVQLYEGVLVLTAIFLARRKIWYDSTLLVGLENLFVFVPFILISLAALIDSSMGWQLCLAGAVLATVRFASLKKYFTQLNLPARLLEIGALLLALNVALPLLFRHFGETKIGIYIPSGPAYVMNEFTWLLILPTALALANLVPHGDKGGDLPPQRRWLPAGMFATWLTITGVHVYALDYIYQFEFRAELFAPIIWVVAWTAFRMIPLSQFAPHYSLMILPALTPLLAVAPGNKTFIVLTISNIALCVVAGLRQRDNLLARHLAFGSVLLLFAGMPQKMIFAIHPGIDRVGWLFAALAVYLILWTVISRNPKLALFGAIAFGGSVVAILNPQSNANAIHWAWQAGAVFALLHSLRWNDSLHPGTNFVRGLLALIWLTHSFVWMNDDAGKFWMPFVPAVVVLAICYIIRFSELEWFKLIVPITAGLVMLTGPACAVVDGLRAASAGALSVAGSFLLLGVGTIAALTRKHWHKHE